MNYTENKLSDLRKRVSLRMSEKRFSHTLGVERCAALLGKLILPDFVSELQAAAILHDVAKEMPLSEQISLLKAEKFPLTDEDTVTVGVIHSFTAPIVIKRDFSDFATQNILSATEKHTVGSSDMTLFDMIIFVSDYIEDTRVFESCFRVREALLTDIENDSYEKRIVRLKNACIMAIDGAENALLRQGLPINSRMNKTRNFLLKDNFQN